MKILLAEDSRTQAALMRVHLQRKGHEVLIAENGIEAIKKAFLEGPDLIVSDVVMPRLNGYQVCRLLRDDPATKSIPVVLLTSLDQQQDRFWGEKSGADRFITKGNDLARLVEEIHSFAVEHVGAGAAPGGRSGGEQGRVDLDADVMERVIHLLDRNLFESTVASEIQNLVKTLDDYRAAIVGVLEILRKVIEFHVGAVHLAGDEGQGLFLLVNKPVDRRFLDVLRERLLRETPGAAALEPEAVEIIDPDDLLGLPGPHPELPESVLIARLLTKERPSGTVALASAEAHAYPERVAQTFEMVARQANIVIDYARLYERTKQLSITDGLTKLYNHRFFQDALRHEYARQARNRSPLSLVLLDIDHFKRFNDTYGHQQGDVVLQELARVLRGQVRSLDIVARYGGEEFAIVMPDAAADVAARVAERLRLAMEGHGVPGPSGMLTVTISLGVATCPREGITDPSGLIAAADRALYRAKAQGRNRVASAE